MKIEGKVALVTGGASGIGRALVQRLLENGIKFVSILDCDERDAASALKEFSEKFEADRVRFIRCDATDQERLRGAFEETYNVHKALDIVVNNAGIISKDHLQVMNVNVIPYINGMVLANEFMTKTKRTDVGVIINTSSISGFIAHDEVTFAYTATKHAINGMTKAFQCSCDGFSKDLRCVAVCPGGVDTAIITRHNFNTPQEKEIAVKKMQHMFTSMDQVIDGYVQAIEDDSLSGALIRIGKEVNTVTQG